MRKQIRITVKNETAVNEAIEIAEGRARVRCADYDWIVKQIDRIEATHVVFANLPIKSWTGIEVSLAVCADLPNAYYRKGFRPQSTFLKLARRSTGWFLKTDSIKRVGCSNNSPLSEIIISPEQEAEIQRRIARSYYVRR